jgi:hypothetical protein
MELISYAFNGNAIFNFEKCLFVFEGYRFVLYPGGEKKCDVIQCLIQNDRDREEAFASMNRFLNLYAREHNVFFRWECGVESRHFKKMSDDDFFNLEPFVGAKRNYFVKIPYFTTIAKVNSSEQSLALELLNESKASQNIFYTFLCYWKILAIRLDGQQKGHIVNWINEAVVKVKLEEWMLHWFRSKEITNIGLFLKESCRHAISHIDHQDAVVYYSASDLERIKYGNAIMENLVEYFLKVELLVENKGEGINVVLIKQ